MKKKIVILGTVSVLILLAGLAAQSLIKSGDEALGTRKYSDFQTPKFCGTSCHGDIYQQWTQAMMSQAYTHHWDEIEYFKLAVPHAEKDSVVRPASRRAATAAIRPWPSWPAMCRRRFPKRTAGPMSRSPARSATR